MGPRRIQPQETAPDLPPEKAYSALSAQLAKLLELKIQTYGDAAKAAEDEWFNLTEKLVIRSFGSASTNCSNLRRGQSAGEYYLRPAFGDYRPRGYDTQDHRNFLARLQAYEGALKSCLAELELDLPDTGIQGVYQPGEEYEFYRDVKECLETANNEIFVIDPYLDTEIFDVYAKAISRSIHFRLLSANVPTEVHSLAQKYAAGGNLEFRASTSIHDRVLFADDRVWVLGQSIKDAAKKKPTYIVEHDELLMRPVYENIWHGATVII